MGDSSIRVVSGVVVDRRANELAAEVLSGRLAGPVAAVATLDAATELVKAMSTDLAVDQGVYEGLQRLACEVETAIFAADQVRHARAGHQTENRP